MFKMLKGAARPTRRPPRTVRASASFFASIFAPICGPHFHVFFMLLASFLLQFWLNLSCLLHPFCGHVFGWIFFQSLFDFRCFLKCQTLVLSKQSSYNRGFPENALSRKKYFFITFGMDSLSFRDTFWDSIASFSLLCWYKFADVFLLPFLVRKRSKKQVPTRSKPGRNQVQTTSQIAPHKHEHFLFSQVVTFGRPWLVFAPFCRSLTFLGLNLKNF